jgi:hypothetical protein
MELAWTLHTGESSKTNALKIALPTVLTSSTVLLLLGISLAKFKGTVQLFTFLFRRIYNISLVAGKTGNRKRCKKLILGGMGTSDELGEINPGQEFVLPFVRFDDIVTATHNFSYAYKIGQGGFGKVYMVTFFHLVVASSN